MKMYRDLGDSLSFHPANGYGGPWNAVPVPCGRCFGCFMRRKRDWALRMRHEAQMHKRNCFLTLTFDEDHLPFDRSLDVRDWQLFAKRMRKRMGRFRFFHAGEYGPENLRPHYHACIFGLDFEDKVEVGASKSGRPMWMSATLTELWKQGIATVQPFSERTAAYTAGYVVEKARFSYFALNNPRVCPHTGEVWEVRPEYHTMSRRPGIGHGWLEKYGETDLWRGGEAVSADGHVSAVPHYYVRKLKETDPEAFEAFDEKRKNRAKFVSDEQLAIREKNAIARYNLRHGKR